MANVVEFFYDFSSPNAYFAAEQLPAIARSRGARIVWRPFLLGGLFKSLGTPAAPLMATPAKAMATQADLRRWSKKYSIAFNFPSRFPLNTVRALRAVISIERNAGDPAAIVQSLFRAYWVDDQDLAAPEVLAELLRQGGYDASKVLAESESDAVKQALRDATAEAERRGVFGAPTFFVDNELFFGKDRLEFVVDALDG